MAKQTTLEERFGLCPYATAQSLISGKWAVLILLYLGEGPTRFNELLRKMPKMTHATLAVQLRTLEEDWSGGCSMSPSPRGGNIP